METLTRGAKWLGLPLTAGQRRQFETYCQELLVHADRAGLTAVRDAEGIERRHFLESLALLVVLGGRGILGQRAIDIGTGAGFPSLPIKIVRPALQLTLLESAQKRAAFLCRLIERLGLTEVTVVSARAEVLARDPDHRESYDLALARAVAPLPILAELALPFLRLGGWLVTPKGSGAAREVEEAASAIALCGGCAEGVERLVVPETSLAPTLVLVRKAALTPGRFPRRPGIPAKRPLR
jgi:16S rRNA (guanine527-N7)-methyltransferase